jgi:glucokinase
MTTQDQYALFLAGDVGGTKTSLALYRETDDPVTPLVEKTFLNNKYKSLEELVSIFLKEQDRLPGHACFGVAGPVHNNSAQLTNHAWFVDGDTLKQQFGFRSIRLINDMVAASAGVLHLPENALKTLNIGQPDPRGAVAVLAPGTGLGEGFLVRCGPDSLPCPSEGGHSSFAPVNELQAKLLRFMLQKAEHVPTEMVCSGLGISNLYDFLKTEMDEPPELAARFSKESDPAEIISEAALSAIDKSIHEQGLPVQTIHLFVDILASEAANLALKVLATGGVYIGGGISPRILPFLTADRFMSSFCRGKYKDMLGNIPIHIILEPRAPLIGAAALGMSKSLPVPHTEYN